MQHFQTLIENFRIIVFPAGRLEWGVFVIVLESTGTLGSHFSLVQGHCDEFSTAAATPTAFCLHNVVRLGGFAVSC